MKVRADRFRRLRNAQLLELHEDEDSALLGRELVEKLVEDLRRLRASRLFERRAGPHVFETVGKLLARATPRLFPPVAGDAQDDAEQPGAKRGTLLETSEVPVND